jgi:hypothetical protein
VANTVAWVVPTHLPRRKTYFIFAESSKRFLRDVDEYVVVSTHAEFAALKFPEAWKVRPLVLSDWYSADEIMHFVRVGSIINVKKLYALNILKDNYSRIVITDDEVEFFASISAADIESHNIIFPLHKTDNKYLQKIINAPLSLINSRKDRNWLLENIVRDNYYGWFSDLPIYESEQIPKFLQRFGLDNSDGLFRLTYESFDYVMYQYNCALEDQTLNRFDFLTWESPPVGLSWFEFGIAGGGLGEEYLRADGKMRKALWISNIELLVFYPKARMVFHTDRIRGPRRNFRSKLKAKIIFEIDKRF